MKLLQLIRGSSAAEVYRSYLFDEDRNYRFGIEYKDLAGNKGKINTYSSAAPYELQLINSCRRV